MSQEFQAPAERERPSTVTYAGYSAYTVFALSIVSAVLGIMIAGQVLDAVRNGFADMDVPADQQSALDAAMSVSTVVVYAVVLVPTVWALILAIVTPFFMKGGNGARITAWVFSGLGICCGAAAIPGSFDAGGQMDLTGQDPEAARAMERAIAELDIPGWIAPVSTGVAVVTVLLYLAIIILLALPKSNEYFRKAPPQPEFLPPPPAP